MQAGLLLAGRPLLVALGLPCPTGEAILTATGATRSSAYEVSAALVALLPSLVASRGRPPKPPEPPPGPSDPGAALTAAVLAFVLDNPGCAQRLGERRHYSDAFRHFILEQVALRPDLELEGFAVAAQVPLGTLKDWLRAPDVDAAAVPTASSPPPEADTRSLHIQTVLDAWGSWKGTFTGFCQHVSEHLHVPLKANLVRRILATYGRRRSSSHPGRSPDESALRGAFKTHFPGAQWVGDGMQVSVIVDGKRFVLNLELDVDAASGALVGLSVRDQEDSEAVIEAFNQGTATTGGPPLALLLDNRPSNHTPDVERGVGDTLLIRATPQRPQNKAHVEGAFGLFSQVLPLLVLDTSQAPSDIAKHLLWMAATLWACTTNHRPRKDRGGRSRAELYGDKPSDEQLEQARRELRALAERQELARRTLEARRRPEVLTLLDFHFDRLGLLDPNRHLSLAIARYALDHILAAIAIFDGKRSAGTLPSDVDARYLLGIVRNVAAEVEGEAIAKRLLELRLQVRDQMLTSLTRERDSLFALRDLHHACQDCVDEALATQSTLERIFWLDSLAGLLRSRSASRLQELYLDSARRIYTTFSVPLPERQHAVCHLTQQLVPLA